MLNKLFTGLFAQWASRRGLEIGGLLVAVSAIDPTVIQTILGTVGALLSGDFENVSVGALIGLVSTIGGLIWNARSTFTPHVVTEDGKQVSTKRLSEPTKTKVEKEAATVAKHQPSMFERLFGK